MGISGFYFILFFCGHLQICGPVDCIFAGDVHVKNFYLARKEMHFWVEAKEENEIQLPSVICDPVWNL